MKRLLILSVLAVSIAFAGDYQIVRDTILMPGGTTNVVTWYPAEQFGVEVVELQAYGGATQDTATVSRVTGDGVFTNTLAVLTTPAATLCTVTNFGALAWGAYQRDALHVAATGTNTFRVCPMYRVHRP